MRKPGRPGRNDLHIDLTASEGPRRPVLKLDLNQDDAATFAAALLDRALALEADTRPGRLRPQGQIDLLRTLHKQILTWVRKGQPS